MRAIVQSTRTVHVPAQREPNSGRHLNVVNQ
jgi:hypothetical protein